MDLVALIERDLQPALMLGALLLARLLPLVWFTPWLGGQVLPAPLKIALALTLTALTYGAVAPAAGKVAALGPLVFAMLLFKELLIGAALGQVASLLFLALGAAGWLVDNARGAGQAEVNVPILGTRASPLGALLPLLAVALLFASGAHRLFLDVLLGGYALLPPVLVPSSSGLGGLTALVIELTAEVLALGLGLAAPVLAVLVLAEIALGWMSRFAPQLNPYFTAMPLRAGLGLAVFLLVCGLVVAELPRLLGLSRAHLSQATRLLVGP